MIQKSLLLARACCLLSASMICGGSLSATSSTAIADPSGQIAEIFWRSGPEKPEGLSSDWIYPQGNRFLFSFYSVGGEQRGKPQLTEKELQQALAGYKDRGFGIIGPQYGLNQRVLQDAKDHGFGVVYSVGLGKREFRDSTEDTLSMQQIYERVYNEVKSVAEDRNIVMWDLRPEELRPWRKREMELLETSARAIRDADLFKRPIYHYCPGHYSAERLKEIAKVVDIVGKGMYTNYSSQKNSRVWCRWSIEQEVEAIETSGSNAVPIAIPEMFQQPAEDEVHLIPTWVRHDVYLAMVSGAKGVLVFSLRPREDFDAWQAYYDTYQEVAQQLLGEKGLADVFLFGERRDDLEVEIIDGSETVKLSFRAANIEDLEYSSIHSTDIAYGNHRYFIAVNSANEKIETAITGFPYASAHAQSLLDADEPFDIGEGEFMVTFAPLEVKAWKITQR